MKKEYRVVAGIMIQGDRVLCGKRGPGFFESKWEFPGGKIEFEETEIEALIREIKEELGCSIDRCAYFTTVEAEYEEFLIHMDTYLVHYIGNGPVSKVHQRLIWETIPRLSDYDWCDADQKVVSLITEYGMEKLHNMLGI